MEEGRDAEVLGRTRSSKTDFTCDFKGSIDVRCEYVLNGQYLRIMTDIQNNGIAGVTYVLTEDSDGVFRGVQIGRSKALHGELRRNF